SLECACNEYTDKKGCGISPSLLLADGVLLPLLSFESAGPGPSLMDDLPGLRAVADFLASERAHVWLLSLVGSVAVGLSGIFPLLVIPIEAGAALKTEAGCHKLKQLLSFAIGGLLGDVFLHLLPEAWELSAGKQNHYMTQGLWVIIGLLAFLLLEKMFPDQDSPENPMSGYLNLLANCIDNFTHGLAVSGSFLVSKKVGFLTTFAILLHEIPHEVGDFAILLRAGFDRWSAARMQVTTALVGVLGAFFALCTQSPKGAGRMGPINSTQVNTLLITGILQFLYSVTML
uniref:Zinc transporter ZIP13 n=1 Tax=Amphilophus citrinellus TaxID=61819 RepID=A0A3Q0RBK3_AMPCI